MTAGEYGSRFLNEKDHTGVATQQLADVFKDRKHPLERLDNVAEVLKMDPRDLRRVVSKPNYEFTGLDLADRIFLAIGEDIAALAVAEVVTIIPANETTAAVKMAKDEFWVNDYEYTEDELAARATELADLRRKTLGSYRVEA